MALQNEKVKWHPQPILNKTVWLHMLHGEKEGKALGDFCNYPHATSSVKDQRSEGTVFNFTNSFICLSLFTLMPPVTHVQLKAMVRCV